GARPRPRPGGRRAGQRVLPRRPRRRSREGLPAGRGAAPPAPRAGRVGAPPRRARLDLREHLRAQPRPRELASPAFPGPPVELTDPFACGGVANNEEHPRLSVLGAGRVGGRLEHPLDELVGNWFVAERPVGALRTNDLEEVGWLSHADRSPKRRNVFTYMIRSSGVLAHASHASVPGCPIRSATSGVMVRKAASGSSVSIS